MMKKKWIAMFTAAALICSSAVPAQAGAAELPEDPVTEVAGDVQEPVLDEIQDEHGDDASEKYVEGEALVKFSGSSPVAAAAELPIELETIFSMDTAASVTGEAAPASLAEGGEIALASSDVLSTQELIDALEDTPGVEYAEPNYIYHIQSTNDPLFEKQWHLQDQTDVAGGTNVNAVWDTATGSEDLVVAVIDTGIDYTHPDLAPVVVKDSEGHLGRNFTDDGDPYDPMDVQGHGTHVAGILGAAGNNGIGTSGMNQHVGILTARTGDSDGSFWLSDCIEAYQYIMEEKAAGLNIVAANCSWGGEGMSLAIKDAVDAAGRAGIISVFASGNYGQDMNLFNSLAGDSDPASGLVVNSCDADGRKSYFTNYGRTNTDLFAPGEDILSTLWVGDAGSYEEGGVVRDILAGSEIGSYPASGKEGAEAVSISGRTYTVTPVKADTYYGIELKCGDLSEYADEANYLGVQIKADGAGAGASLEIGLKFKEESSVIYTVCPNEDPFAVAIPTYSGGAAWDDLSVYILMKSTEQDIGRTYRFELSKLDLVGEAQHGYGLDSGTSMAAPVVAGALTLLADYYDVEKMEDPVKQAEAMREIRARIAGGVTRTEEMEELCASGGYLNLEKAVTDPYPVLDTLIQEGSSATLYGYFFGGDAGTLTMDGSPVKVTEWKDDHITFEVPEQTATDMHEFCVTTAADAAQYGRDLFQVETPSGKANDAYFEKLPAPDFEELGVEYTSQMAPKMSMEAYGGRLYFTGYGLHCSKGKKTYPALLVYNEKTQGWSREVLDYIDVDISDYYIEMAEADGCLYFLVYRSGSSDSRALRIWRQDLLTGKHRLILDDKGEVPALRSNAVCDGQSIWYSDGKSLVELDIESGKWKDSGVELLRPRSDPVLEYVDGRIVVTGETEDDGSITPPTEIIENGKNLSAEDAAKLPVNVAQSAGMTAGSYDGKVILTGPFADEEHSADTYLFDMETNTWTEAPWKLAETKVYYPCGVVDGEYFYVSGYTYIHNKNEMKLYRRRLERAAAPEPETAAKADAELKSGLRVKWSSGNLAVSWGKVSDADGYDVFVEKCGNVMNAKDLVTTVKKKKTTTAAVEKLKGRALSQTGNYKARVKAYRMESGEKTYVAESYVMHIAGSQNKRRTNAKKVTADRASHVLKPGQTAVVSVDVVKQDSKRKLLPAGHGKKLHYWSTNPEIAAVNAKGEITAKRAGVCTIYAAAINGVRTKIKMTVR